MAQPVVVLKFGGTSVSTKERWETIAKHLRKNLDDRKTPFVVCSAISGVSNQLEELLGKTYDNAFEPILNDIRDKHRELASDMGLDADVLLEERFETLHRLALGASLTGEVSPRLWARTLAMGELMLTTLAAEYLKSVGFDATFLDAREWLNAEAAPSGNERRRFLSASCHFDADKKLQTAVAKGGVFITQGFIANDEDETVLLGRGGSDTSAAYFAAKLAAERLEIWTDVPGMYTANPRAIDTARLLKTLHYDEAQEIATTGAKVLHPRCIEPVRRAKIPLTIRCTPQPELDGTTIRHDVPDFGAQVKAVSSKDGVVLISMETVGMWQQVGFLADAFACFKNRGLSIDLVATSETNVTVSLDPGANALEGNLLDALIDDLAPFCVARVIGPCTAVSLVGQKIRAILHRLGPALEAFEEQEIYLVSQAASDLNVTFVVEEAQASRLVNALHTMLFEEKGTGPLFGESWRETFGDAPTREFAGQDAWWESRREDLLGLVKEEDHAVYAYHLPTVKDRAQQLMGLQSIDHVYYALKANDNADVIATLHDAGIQFECVSHAESEHLAEALGEKARVMFTPNFCSRREYELGFKDGHVVNVDNIHPLEHWGDTFRGQQVLLRVDPGYGDGHHRYVKTAGKASKFGISMSKLDEVAALCETHGVEVIGLHAHVGSGILEPSRWAETAIVLAEVATRFPTARILNLGGGLGIPEKPWHHPLDLEKLDELLMRFKEANPTFELWLEPGRFLVAESGVMLARVNQIKTKGDAYYVGVETGMNSLIRPALYGSYHRIVNLSKWGQPNEIVADVVGPICESADVLGHKRRLPKTDEGDVLLIATAGAYGRTMSSLYNRRAPAIERALT